MSYPIADPGQRPSLHAELQLGHTAPLIPVRVHSQRSESSQRSRHPGRSLAAAPDLLVLIPPQAAPGAPDRLRDRGLDAAIADRAAREVYAEWIAPSVENRRCWPW